MGYRGTTPFYVRIPPVVPGDCRIRLDLVHGNHDIGNVKAKTATLCVAALGLVLHGRLTDIVGHKRR